MDKVLHCDCGFEARADHEDGLVAAIRRHAREAHGMTLSLDDARVLAARRELEALHTTPRDTTKEER